LERYQYVGFIMSIRKLFGMWLCTCVSDVGM